jgi:hypothetical protein
VIGLSVSRTAVICAILANEDLTKDGAYLIR